MENSVTLFITNMSFEEQMLKSSNNVFKVTIWVLKGIDSLFEDTIFLNNGVLLFFLIDSLADKNTNQQIHKYFPRLDDPENENVL